MITTAGNTAAGTIYDGFAVDGSISEFFFNTASAFDISSGFEQLSYDGSHPSAVFKFTALEIAGGPMVNITGGPR
jgi:hypothetical protein